MQTIKVDAIVWDPSVYPREKWNTHTIDTYADALKGGAQFPPLVLEQGTNRLLDGVHRWKAYQKYAALYQEHLAQPALDGINADGWAPALDEVPVEFHEIPAGVPAKLYAASLSVKHGDRISNAERKAVAREVYEENPEFILQNLKDLLAISMGSAHDYVADILARRKEAQKITALRLDTLGWTSEEVGKAVSLSEGRIRQLALEFSDLKKLTKKTLDEGHPHLDVAERYNMPLILVWAIDLEGRTDAERLERLGIAIQPYDVWNFGKCHDLFGAKHPGRIPGELIAHVLYFYTEPGAMVVDPMVGSGTTLDVCLAMGRKCYAYDIDARHNRPDVILHDIAQDGWPERVKKADLIFWDPPYFRKMDSMNIGEDGYIEGSISKLGPAGYLDFFSTRLGQLRKMVRPGTKIAFLMSDWDDDTGKEQGIFLWAYANQLQGAGWKMVRHIQAPLSTQQVHPDIVTKFRKARRLARLERYLLIAEA
jgi:hypothetical protein